MAAEVIKEDFKTWVDQADMPKGKKQVALAAIKLFSEDGFDGTSTKAIAQEAGVSQATIFKYFKTKDDLLDWIISPIMKNIIPVYVSEFKDQLSSERMNLQAVIHFIVRNRYQFLIDNKEIAIIVITTMMTNEDVKNHFVEMIKQQGSPVFTAFSKLLSDTGEVRSGIDFLAVMRMIISQILIYFIQVNKILPQVDSNQDKDLSQIEEFIYRSIKK